MIITQNSGTTQNIFIPRNTDVEADSYTLSLHSEGMNRDFSFNGLTNSYAGSNYYKFAILIDNLPEGEYNYSVTADDINDIGLLRIGDISTTTIKYNSDNSIYEYNG